ncbi:MAG: hypothetical protein AB7P20_08810 [Rhizobiaceae bacterium]
MVRQAYILLLLTAIFWGGNAIAGKLAVSHISPMVLTTMLWLSGRRSAGGGFAPTGQ